jgi:hypothetical protein
MTQERPTGSTDPKFANSIPFRLCTKFSHEMLHQAAQTNHPKISQIQCFSIPLCRKQVRTQIKNANIEIKSTDLKTDQEHNDGT